LKKINLQYPTSKELEDTLKITIIIPPDDVEKFLKSKPDFIEEKELVIGYYTKLREVFSGLHTKEYRDKVLNDYYHKLIPVYYAIYSSRYPYVYVIVDDGKENAGACRVGGERRCDQEVRGHHGVGEPQGRTPEPDDDMQSDTLTQPRLDDGLGDEKGDDDEQDEPLRVALVSLFGGQQPR